MQNYVDFFLANWYISIPISLIVVIIVGILIRKGRLESLEFFGVKINFDKDKKASAASRLYNLFSYDIKFTKIALDNISSLRINEDKVISLIDHEFTHHINYFLWDLQDYPLPVQQNYIIVLDKIDKSLTIRAVKSSTLNEAQLASINNLLADYRRLCRYKYRTNKDYILRREAIREILKAHHHVTKLLIKHYELYKEPSWKGNSFLNVYYGYLESAEEVEDPLKIAEYKKKAENCLPTNKSFAYNIIAIDMALGEIRKSTIDLENEFISSNTADKEVVLSLERSLQYIHKTINLLLAD